MANGSSTQTASNIARLNNYIQGKMCAPHTQQYLDNYEPATGQVYTKVANSGQEDIKEAVEAAQTAFPDWSKLPAARKSQYLRRIAAAIEDRKESFIHAESKDTGKPVWLTRKVDIPRAISNFRFFAGAAQHFSSEAHQTENEAINYTLRQPLGVVGCISPWNLPLYLFTWKIAPALAAGNCVVAKPSEITPMTAHMLGEVCQEVDLPPGVLNIIQGTGKAAGETLVTHPKVKAITFTGSSQTGKHIAQQAAGNFKKVALEMGGKNPNIIFDDCDFENMLDTTIQSSFANQGQVCLCGSRIFIQSSIYNKFKEAFVERTRQLKVGDPKDSENRLGAVVSKQHQEKILSYIKGAKEEGGRILCGGRAIEGKGRCKEGYFVAPTIIEGLDMQCRANQEEIFGPVVTLQPFNDEKEVIQKANAVEYGLCASLWTEHLTLAHRMAQQLEAGIIWINTWLFRDLRTPFGGMKSSGYGSREGGWEIMRFFTTPKNVCVKL